jgi:ADP-ribosylglycohydrolase
VEERTLGALYGLFVGDALSMPAHWYYDRRAIDRDYGRIVDYLPPQNPHPDSILWRSRYAPPRPGFDILHDQARYWGRKGVHYHQFLRPGENTLNLLLCRLLLTSLDSCGGYDPDDFLERYIAFMTTPGSHRDTYVEECHRHFFTNLAAGRPPRRCGVTEKHIGGLVGLVPILVRMAAMPAAARAASKTHLALTHPGAAMATAADAVCDILLPVLSGVPLADAIGRALNRQANPHFGRPLRRWIAEPDDAVVGRRLSTACYVSDAVPAVIYLALKYAERPEEGLVANVHLGGDNAHRGALLGSLFGAAMGTQAFPERWIEGLAAPPPR